jgi:hypothetical protein
MSPRVNHGAIARVLAGAGSYDSLSEPEQAIVRARWAGRAAARREALDYGAQFDAAGESYSEIDEHGDLVVRPARG